MNQTKTIPIILTIIAVLFVTFLVLLSVNLLTIQSVQSDPVKIDIALSPTVVPTATNIPEITPYPTLKTTKQPTSIIPNNWKTYTNTQYGFEFRYPKEFVVVKNNDYQESNYIFSQNFETPDYQHYAVYEGMGDPYESGYGLFISLEKDSCKIVKQNDLDVVEVENISINGISAQKFLFRWDVAYDRILFANSKQGCFSLYFSPGVDKIPNNKPLFETIIGSLKFTN